MEMSFCPYSQWGSNLVLDPIDFHCMDKNSWSLLQNIMLSLAEHKICHTGLECHEGE